MATQSSKAKQQTIVAFPFPLKVSESLFFATKGAIIDKAILTANEMTLSILKPVYEDASSNDTPPECELRFFGDKPFHAALAAKWDVKITLFVKDSRTPSLMLIPAERTVTWDDVPEGIFCDTVTAGSDSGEVVKTFVYTPLKGGFKRTTTS